MAYNKTLWVNDSVSAINETNLNKIEQGIYDNSVSIENLISALFPIGQIVIKGDNNDYSNWLGFTWERTAVGKVLVGIADTDSDFDTIGKTGGEKTHTLIFDELPSRTVVQTNMLKAGTGANGTSQQTGAWTIASLNDAGRANNYPHNNLQPYQVVAYWKRIA